jgi:trans-2,3-dihydro-3-hydroxyanthranilate isomerase
MFAPELGVVEDAATGSAAGPLGVYLVRHGVAQPDVDSPSGDARIRLEQGVEMGRPSRIDIDVEVAVTGETQTIRDVRVGGEAVVIAEGELYLP